MAKIARELAVERVHFGARAFEHLQEEAAFMRSDPMEGSSSSFYFVLKMVVRIGMLDWAIMFLYLAFLLPFNSSRSSASPASAKQ
jgi:hypothetical protein